MASEPTAAGSTILAGNVARTTATAVQRLQAAGAIVVAKTTMTEFAGTAHHPALPTPVNPYDSGRSPAGSSSGSGVAVAAGLLPAALGSDTVASIRLPAAAAFIPDPEVSVISSAISLATSSAAVVGDVRRGGREAPTCATTWSSPWRMPYVEPR